MLLFFVTFCNKVGSWSLLVSGTLVCGHGLGRFPGAAIVEISGDAGRAEGVIANR
jgi:hypothetical protein